MKKRCTTLDRTTVLHAAASLALSLLLVSCGQEDAPKYGGSPPPAEAAYGQCAFCHNPLATHMVETGGHKDLSVKCELCHTDLQPGEVGPGHRSIPACSDCHDAQRTHHDPAADSERQCVVCHTPHGSTNLRLIRQMIDTTSRGTQPILFINREGLADGGYASSTHPGTGICETCHTQTRYYRADATGSPHFTNTCVTCHEHATGFATPPAPATATAVPTRTPSNTRTSTPTTTATATDSPTATQSPTLTASATPTGPSPTPTATPTGPSPTPTLTLTHTPSPTATATVPTPTPTPIVLRVVRVTVPPAGIDDPTWNDAPPLRPSLSNASTGLLYADGVLNATETFAGLADFNNGGAADLELRAVHDGDSLYILARWNDETQDLDSLRWLFNGPADPRKPGESAAGWTSQRNDDKLSLAFEIDAASSEFGDFSTAGCAAACHNTATVGGLDMRPQQGSVDLWVWKTSRSEPLGYAADQVSRADSGRTDDGGVGTEIRNIAVSGNNRSGPSLEWDGTAQSFTRWDGQSVMLDPGFFLLAGHGLAFAGDAAAGDTTYQTSCAGCHGNRGQGGIGPALNSREFARMSRAELDAGTAAPGHPGANAYNALSATGKTNLLARLRGLSGVPGYSLTQPSGSAADLTTQSNVDSSAAEHPEYQLLIIRKLQTSHSDDAQFVPGQQYVFGIGLMDGDGRNHIGSQREILALDP